MSRRPLLLGLAALLLLAVAAITWVLTGLLWPSDDPQPLPQPLLSVQDPFGAARLQEAVRVDHDALVPTFAPQQHGSFCGVASVSNGLRALGLDVTQDSLFIDDNADVRTYTQVLFGGVTLQQAADLAVAHGVSVTTTHATDTDLATFRLEALSNLGRAGDVLLVNYDRSALGQQGGGHVSPLGAYHQGTDSFLVIDTAAYRYPHTWVPADRLFEAMQGDDSSSGQSRGYLTLTTQTVP